MPLRRINKIGYASGNLAKSLQWNSLDFLYLYFLVDIAGIGPTVAGMILLVSLFWDGLSDPLFGHVIDRFGVYFRSYQTIIYFTAPLCAVAFVLLFLLPLSMPGSAAAWALGASIMFRTTYTLVDVPHNALLAKLSEDSHERTALSAYRFAFSAAGTILVGIIVSPYLIQLSAGSGFAMFAVMVAVVYLLAMLTSTRLSETDGQPALSLEAAPLAAALKDLLANRRFRSVLLVCASTALLVTAFARFGVFYAKSWLGDPAMLSTLVVCHALGQIVALPFWARLARVYEKRTAAICAHVLMGLTCLGFLLVLPTGLATAALFFFITGLAIGGITVMNWALVPDTIEYTERATGKRHEALTFGLLLLVLKGFAGLSLAISGWALSAIGYEATADSVGDQLTGIAVTMATLPVVGALICLLSLARLSISHAEHAGTRASLLKQQG